MNSPRNWSKLSAAAALLHVAMRAALAGGEDRAPVINAAVPDFTANPAQLTIKGENLGSLKPFLSLDALPLVVSNYTPTMVR